MLNGSLVITILFAQIPVIPLVKFRSRDAFSKSKPAITGISTEKDSELVAITLGVGSSGISYRSITGIFTPLFQTNFFPDLMQVYLEPDEVEV